MPNRNILYRAFVFFLSLAIANLAVPQSLVVAVGKPISDALARKAAADAAARAALDKRKAVSHTRALSVKELNTLEGRTAQCPYIAGNSKWDPQFEGVDLMTGNYTLNATDLSFDGGYGIPVNITRSYSANNGNDSPFGYGWTLSADIRTTAGGVLKSKSGPNMCVPTNYKERSPLETNPNLTVQPIDAVTAADSSGKDETIEKDADGQFNQPSWDQNVSNPVYTQVIQGGSVYNVLQSQTVTTPDGTVYKYQAEGSYQGGTYPYGQPTQPHTPANVLKCTSATDRNGNTTSYIYGTTPINFYNMDGTTLENPLLAVSMPNHHTIYFVWGTAGSQTPTNRISQVFDTAYQQTVPTYYGSATVPTYNSPLAIRIVNYGYTNGYLTSVTSPANLKTQYGYSNPFNSYNTDGAWVINLITNPQGLQTSITSFVGIADVQPYGAYVEAVMVNEITQSNGVATIFNWKADQSYQQNSSTFPADSQFACYYEQHSGNGSGPAFATYWDYGRLYGTVLEVDQYLDGQPKDGNAATITDDYDVFAQNDLTCYKYDQIARPVPTGSVWLAGSRQLNYTPYGLEYTVTTSDYNFMNNPLDVTVQEYETPLTGGVNLMRTATTSYAYWNADKYFQQKAVKDPGGRISFTDYYSNLAQYNNPQSTWGQKYQVFDPKYGGTSAGSGNGTDGWRSTVSAAPNQYSGQFSYDSKGRLSTAQKLQSGTAGQQSTYTYVTTAMVYGADGDGSWGQCIQTTEDQGPAPHFNRITKVNTVSATDPLNSSYTIVSGFTPWGKPADSVDANGNEFQTFYDQDGKVQNVYQVGYGNVATYTYGGSSTPISNGLPISVTDNIGSVQQQIDYVSSGSGVGQAYHVYEYRNNSTTADNVCTYAYGATGDRSEATYTTGTGATLAQWGYFDYIPVGDPSKNARAFQTLCKLDGNNNRTPEEFHYAYDSQGRILDCAFAQTPSNNTPDSNGYYDKALAATRCRAHYEYDAGGRLYWIAHYWDTLSGGSYASQAILGQYCDYEVNTGLNRGLKLDAKYETPSSPGSSTFQISQTDTYGSNGYDPKLDYLIAASYGDNQPNPNQTWSYDAAGNRNDTVADTLNRPITIGGVACQSDMNGNRKQFGSIQYSWDQLNRLHQYNNSTTYTYRADGMRVYKTNSSGSTSYRYDGQMGMEDIDYAANGSVSKVTDYGIGARGIDAMYVTQSGSTSANYPLYDAHGNIISTLSRYGTAGYTTSNYRTFDAWGNVRVGQPSGDPKGRYCANLGHKQDDESGLVYMRARYYEPASGRFMSEDPVRDGHNFYVYCSDNPVDFVDQCGKSTGLAGLYQLIGLFCTVGGVIGFFSIATLLVSGVVSIAEAAEAATLATYAFVIADLGISKNKAMLIVAGLAAIGIDKVLTSIVAGAEAGREVGGLCAAAIIGITAYSLLLVGEICESFIEDGVPGSS